MQKSTPRYFFLPLTLLCLIYFAFEYFFNQYAMISVDEFWFAHNIYEYKNGMPYRDFAPYKTVIGYYLLLLPMLFSQGLINTLIFTKNAIAILNTLVIFISATWLSRYFSKRGVLLSVVLLLCMEIMLSYSTNIRVDLLAYWFCLFSLLSLLGNRFILAGLLLGLAFTTSQKAFWYILASNIALGTHWIIAERSRQFLFNILRFNAMTLAVIGTYLLFWSTLVDWHTIYNNVFIQASAYYHLDWYNQTRSMYWYLILLFNPLTFLLWPLTLISLFITHKKDESYQLRRFIIIYAFSILLCLVPYKQIFPYYMQVTLPAFLVLYSAFFTWLIDIYKADKIVIKHRLAFLAFCSAYTTSAICLIVFTDLPFAYLLIAIMAATLSTLFYLHQQLSTFMRDTFKQIVTVSVIFLGMVYPLTVYIAKATHLNGNYQRANLAVIDRLLLDGSQYTAGIELIYNRRHTIAGLRHLTGPAIDYLYHPSENPLPIMSASLYEDPNATIDSVQKTLKDSKVKFYVNNYRMNFLPPTIKRYLNNQYQHFWGSIYIYSPKINAGKQATDIKFAGEYYIQAEHNSPIIINGKSYRKGDHIILENQVMTSESTHDFRVKLIPRDPELRFDPAFEQDDWKRMIF